MEKLEMKYPNVRKHLTEVEWEWIWLSKISRLTQNAKIQSMQYRIITQLLDCGKNWKKGRLIWIRPNKICSVVQVTLKNKIG